MPGGADNHGFLVLGAKPGKGHGAFMKGEIDHHIGPGDELGQLLAEINLADDGHFRNSFRSAKKGLPHSPFRARDDDFSHGFNRPHFRKVAFRISRLFALIVTMGRRHSSSIKPINAAAALTGPGLVSTNKSLKMG